MITVSYNAYCVISKEGDNDIWTVRLQGVVPLLPLCSQIDVGATVNALLGNTFSRENNTHGSWFHDRDPQFASRILGAMTQSCYIGTRDIRSRVIRGPYCIYFSWNQSSTINLHLNYFHGLMSQWKTICIWIGSWRCGCLVTWFGYQLISKPGNKTAAPPWRDPSSFRRKLDRCYTDHPFLRSWRLFGTQSLYK